MTVLDFTRPRRLVAAVGDLVVGKSFDGTGRWSVARVAGVDGDGFVTAIDFQDGRGCVGVYRAFIVADCADDAWRIAPAASVAASGLSELPGLSGDLDGLKAEFRNYKAETVQ